MQGWEVNTRKQPQRNKYWWKVMRIAVISTMAGYPWGGSEELWAAMVDEALDKSFDVAVSVYQWSTTPPKILALQQKGALILKRPGLYGYRRFSKLRTLNKTVDKVIDRYTNPFQDLFELNPGVVCVNQASTYDSVQFSSSADLLNRLYTTSIPYVVVCQAHTDLCFPSKTTREAAVEFFSRANRVVFVSHQNKQMAERQLAQALPNAVVLQNPVNLSNRSAVPWPSSEQISMATVARLEAKAKGQDILFEALSSPVWQSRNWRLRLCGAGPDRDYLEALTRHYAISDRVEFLGHVKDVRAIWSENHLLVLPSRLEGTPLAMVEAMLCGRPAVVTDVGGNAEWIEESDTGFVAEAPTAKSVSAALERAWLAQADWQSMGIRSHETAIKKFDSSPGKSLLQIVLDAAH